MRVITGRFRGRKLKAPAPSQWPGRPPLDRMKEGYFNIVQNGVADCRFLDLFAGAGSMGIEALSRHASRVVFVERHPAAVEAVYANLEHCGLLAPFDPRLRMRPLAPESPPELFEILPVEAEAALARLSARRETFDLAFLDPPYDYPSYERLLAALGMSGMLAPHALVALHHHKKRPPQEEPGGGLSLTRRRPYGQSVLSFYRPAGAREDG